MQSGSTSHLSEAAKRAGPLDVGPLLDPALRDSLSGFELPELDAAMIAAIRSAPFPAPTLSDRVMRTEHRVPHHVPGAPSVPVRVHRPAAVSDPLPAIVTIHGGGYLFGSYVMDDAMLDRWCQSFGIVGVSVEYRLAPETPYPGPLEDCYAALRWAHDNADELGAGSGRIGVYGLSAGGGLAAALTLLARDRGEVALSFALLDSPMLDDRQTSESLLVQGLYVWTASSNELGWRSYLGPMYGTDYVPPYAAAARAADLVGLPPTCVVVGAIDGFRDENVTYAQRLNQAGVPCELHVIAGLPHGYLLAPDASSVQDAERCKDRWLARQLDQIRT